MFRCKKLDVKFVSPFRMTNFIKKKNVTMTVYDDVAEGLKETYKKKLLPLEKETKYHEIQSPMMEDPDFDGKPLVMLIGQYSTGKTTFIRSYIHNIYYLHTALYLQM